MIPKTIHYCWFGGKPLPKLAKKCMKSWKKYCPDYEIIRWDESNFDIAAAPLYVRQAYEAKKWAFVTDYVRLQVVYENGGIYLDTDVELVKRLDPLLHHQAYFGFEDGVHIATGLGFGAVKGAPILQEILDDYRDIPFVLPNGSCDTKTCPVRNTEVFLRHGLVQDNSRQLLDNEILILPSSYLCPLSYGNGSITRSPETISIHWFSASWQTQEQKECHAAHLKEMRKFKRRSQIDYLLHLPNMFLKAVLKEKNYQKLKRILKRG